MEDQKMEDIITLFVFMTGLFAIIGSLYSWGDGLIFTVESDFLAIIIADLFFTGPLCLLLSWTIHTKSKYVHEIKLLVVGILFYSSLLVYITEFSNGRPYDLIILTLPIFGILLAIALLFWNTTDFPLVNTIEKEEK